jgi:hypothetical protein
VRDAFARYRPDTLAFFQLVFGYCSSNLVRGAVQPLELNHGPCLYHLQPPPTR